MWYTYDELDRVTNRTIKDTSDVVLSSEDYSYDAAGNIIGAPDVNYEYGSQNNVLDLLNCKNTIHDADGNLLSAYIDGVTESKFEYDSANRLIKADNNEYTYNAENVRITNLCGDTEITYTYNTNCRLSQLLYTEENGVITKYIYGRGLIGDEVNGNSRVYHFDYRGSTVAITSLCGSEIIRIKYDTYGNILNPSNVWFPNVIFCYNGRDGVITDNNGLLYMRARYYSPKLRRFINADILHGEIADSTSLNRYSYVNGNPVSFVDPLGLSADNRNNDSALQEFLFTIEFDAEQFIEDFDNLTALDVNGNIIINDEVLAALYNALKDVINSSKRPKGTALREWRRMLKAANQQLDDLYGPTSKLAKGLKAAPYIAVGADVLFGIYENYQNGESGQEILTDAVSDTGFGVMGVLLSTVAANAAAGFVAGSVAPGVGNLIGAGVGIVVGIGFYIGTELIEINGGSITEWVDSWW